MNKQEFRETASSKIEEITKGEYIKRDCKLDFHMTFYDGVLYYKPVDNYNKEVKR